MIYRAGDLLAKLHHLVLAGVNDEGELEWIGTDRQWNYADLEAELNK